MNTLKIRTSGEKTEEQGLTDFGKMLILIALIAIFLTDIAIRFVILELIQEAASQI